MFYQIEENWWWESFNSQAGKNTISFHLHSKEKKINEPVKSYLKSITFKPSIEVGMKSSAHSFQDNLHRTSILCTQHFIPSGGRTKHRKIKHTRSQ